jgi:hypothetical protein
MNQAKAGEIKKLGQVQRELDDLNAAIEILESSISSAEGLFSTVLRQIPDEGKNKEELTPDVHYAQVLRSFRIRIDAVRYRLASMNERCEL